MDKSRPEVLGPFRYEIVMVDGAVFRDEYQLSNVKTPPIRPVLEPGEQLQPNTAKWWQMMEWQRYKAAVAHEVPRLESVRQYILWFVSFLLENCVKEKDRQRLIDHSDYIAVADAVIVPRVTQEALSKCFVEEFTARYGELEVLEALSLIVKEESRSTYDVIKTWEIQAINKAGMRFDEWIDLPYEERVIRVAAEVLPKLVESLEVSEKMNR
jgi:hypothetical protein